MTLFTEIFILGVMLLFGIALYLAVKWDNISDYLAHVWFKAPRMYESKPEVKSSGWVTFKVSYICILLIILYQLIEDINKLNL